MVVESTLGLLIFALLLGIKHSMDVDHVIAISSVFTRERKFTDTAKLSFTWAIGHMMTAGIITFILFSIKETILDTILANFEILVAIMLILIGIFTILWELNIIKKGKHSHAHLHDETNIEEICSHPECLDKQDHDFHTFNHIHMFPKSKEKKALFGIGIIHGLASNDELLLLFTISLGFNDYWLIFIGLIIFTLGVVIGMIFYGSILNLSVLKLHKKNIIKSINIILAIVAIGYGIYVGLGGEGANLLPFIS